jgi:hypothetical protein
MVESFGIKILRLQSGEDLIAGVVADEQDNLILSEPLHLVFKRTETGSMMLMIPWLPVELIEENLAIIRKIDILTVVEPTIKLIDSYDKVVQSIKVRLLEIEKESLLDDYDEVDDDPYEPSEEDLETLMDSERVLH